MRLNTMKNRTREEKNLRKKNSKRTDLELRNYNCGYCGNKFDAYVAKIGDKHNTGSTQVVCDKCKNFLKTWQD